MRRFASLAACPLLLATAGCASMTHEVETQFSNKYTCPRERVVVVERPGIAAHTVTSEDATPPDEVARDPQRLALWNQQQAKKHADEDQKTVFDATGCGHAERYACVSVGGDGDSGVVCEDGAWVRAVKEEAAARARLDEAIARSHATIGTQEATLAQEMDQIERLEGELGAIARASGVRPHPRLGLALGEAPGGGVAVRYVAPGSPAAGQLEPGDVITAVDGEPAANPVDFVRVFLRHADASSLLLDVKRGDETRHVTVVLRK